MSSLAPNCSGRALLKTTRILAQALASHFSTVTKTVNPPVYNERSETAKLQKTLSSLLLSHQPPTSNDDYEETYSTPPRKQYENMSFRRRELLRDRKKRRVIRVMQDRRFGELLKVYGKRLGAEATLNLLGKLGRENGVKEYTAMIELCVKRAEENPNEEETSKQICMAFGLLDKMRECGLFPDRLSYKPLIAYVANKGMVEEFHCLVEQTREDNADMSEEELSYYEMVLWIKEGNRDEVLALCNLVLCHSNERRSDLGTLAAGFLLALSENDWTDEILRLLEKVEITEISSLECLTNIFKCFGRSTLQEAAENCILAFKTEGVKLHKLSDFICDFALSLTNMELEKIILIFQSMHEKLEVEPSSSSYNTLIEYCCETFEVHIALDLFEEMCKAGLQISAKTFHPFMQASEKRNELDLVLPIYKMMRNYDVKPTGETFKYMINSVVKMKNFEAAYNLLDEMRELDMRPTAQLYNAIMAGYFRENNVCRALAVLKQMKNANVKADADTYSYLIHHAKSEGEAVKYYEELQRSGIPSSKYVYMALIHVFVKFGNFLKAKEIVKDKKKHEKYLTEIKSAFIIALMSKGRVSEAFEIYDEIKQAGDVPEAKAMRSLIEPLGKQGKFTEMFQLLHEYKDKEDWCYACSLSVLSCIKHKQLSSAIDLLQQLKEMDRSLVDIVCDQIFYLICETDKPNLEDGLALLQAMRKDMDLQPSRMGLDFLLTACVSRKDSKNAKLIFEEYIREGIPYNVLTFLRIFQAFLASGKQKDAALILKRIRKKDLIDPDVQRLIKTYVKHYKCKQIELPF